MFSTAVGATSRECFIDFPLAIENEGDRNMTHFAELAHAAVSAARESPVNTLNICSPTPNTSFAIDVASFVSPLDLPWPRDLLASISVYTLEAALSIYQTSDDT